MKAVTRAICLSLLLTACGGAAATPQIVYVTPAPTAVSPTTAPTPTPRPTPAPDPTFTEDDDRVDEFIREGLAELTGYIGDITNAPDVFDMVDSYRDMGSFAQSQQLIVVSFDPSVCTQEPLDTWIEAMEQIEALSDDYLAAWDSGNFDDFDSDAGYTAGQTARRAVDQLNAAC